MTLSAYIEKYFSGNQAEFARFIGVKPQQITQWVAKGFIVVNDTLYSPRRKISE